MHDKIRAYLEQAGRQIRWKEARGPLQRELESHILDQQEAAQAQGKTEEEAVDYALKQMGDAVEVGTSLDRAHRPKMAWSIFVPALLLMLAGLLLIVSLPEFSSFSVQFYLVGMALGLGVVALLCWWDFTALAKWSIPLYGLLLVVTVLSARVVLNVMLNGQLYYQKVLFAPLMPILYAGCVYQLRGKGLRGWLGCGILGMLGIMVLFYIPSMGMALFFGIIGVMAVCMACRRGWFGSLSRVLTKLTLGIAAVCVAIPLFQYIRTFHFRIQVMLQPTLDPMGDGYFGTLTRQILQGGKLLGHGIEPQFLLERSNDNFSCFGETYGAWMWDCPLTWVVHIAGWLPALLLVVVLGVMLWKLWQNALQQTGELARMLSVAVALLLTLEAFFALLLNLGFLFIVQTVPFFGYGEWGLIAHCAILGLMLSICRRKNLPWKQEGVISYTAEDGFIHYQDGVLTLDFNQLHMPKKAITHSEKKEI